MQRFIVGVVGFLFWLVAIGLTVELVRESTEGQSVVAIGVAALAIGMSGLGLLLARHAWTQRAYPEIAAGIAMWVAGVVCLGFIEISYWVSSYTERYDQYSQERTTKQRRESLTDRDWKALTTGQVPASVAQLQAMISAKQLEPAVTRSAQCSNVTRLDSREPCRQYYELQSQLAAAQQREALEARIKIEQPAAERRHFSANVFAAAEFAAKMRGGDVKDWAYIIIFWSWLLVTLVRDAGLLVMNPLGRARKSVEAHMPEAAQPSGLVIARAPREPMRALERISGVDAVFSPVASGTTTIGNAHSESINPPTGKPDFSPDPTRNPPPTDGGTKAAEVSHQNPEIEEKLGTPEPAPVNIVKIEDGEPWQPAEKPGSAKHARRLAKTEKRKKGDITDWRRACSSEDPTKRTIATLKQAHSSYLAWCDMNHLHPEHKKVFSRKLAVMRKMPQSKDGPRDADGRIFPGLLVWTPETVKTPKRAMA